MIRQYLVLAGILLIAVFIISEIDWGQAKRMELASGKSELSVPSQERAVRPQSNLGSGDLRTGGITARRRPPAALNPLSPGISSGRSSATSSSITSGTSTRFTSGTSSTFFDRSPGPGGGAGRIDNSSPVATQLQPQIGRISAASPARGAANADNIEEATEDIPENSHPEVESDVSIAGHVVNEKGEPVEALSLTLKLRQASEADRERFGTAVLQARTDAEGAYVFTNLVKGEYHVCTVESGGYKPVCQNPRAPHSSADFSIRGMSNGSIYGIVKDTQGNPLSDVAVSASPGQRSRAVTDKDGKFKLGMAVSQGLNYQVYFTLKEYTRQRVAVKGSEVLAGKKLDTVLEKTQFSGFDVRGAIYDQSGTPVAGRTVTLRSPTVKSDLPLRGTSDQNGEFTIKYVQAGKDYRLTVSTGGKYHFDASPYSKMEVFDGMASLQLQLQSSTLSSFSGHVRTAGGSAVEGISFSLYSGSSFAGRAVSDSGGAIRYDSVPVSTGGSTLRISGGSSPRYSFSGIKMAEGEHLSGIELVVDSGQNELLVTVMDEAKTPLAGASAVLIWETVNNGVRSQTVRSQGKISKEGSGVINFSGLGLGTQRLQLRKSGYLPQMINMDISQQVQYEEVLLVRDVEQ